MSRKSKKAILDLSHGQDSTLFYSPPPKRTSISFHSRKDCGPLPAEKGEDSIEGSALQREISLSLLAFFEINQKRRAECTRSSLFKQSNLTSNDIQ
ncbi:hypothetical protein TNCV_3953201 [Trichonephila clavipes]|nr:hypothetical protein TNCV_3953201 [Trichonephila clavipes]